MHEARTQFLNETFWSQAVRLIIILRITKGTLTPGLSQLVLKCLIKGSAEVNKLFYQGSTRDSGLMN